jgi:outer membrane receptor protein involved in Fe transport
MNFRAEYVNTGNSRFSSSLSKYHYVNKVFRELSGLVRAGIPNTEITPETSSTIGAGVDAVLFGNKLNLTVDFYNTINHNLIMPIAVSSAFGVNYLYDNVAETQNYGVEAGIQLALIESKNLKWYVGATVTANKDRVLSLGGQDELILEMEDGSAIRTKVNESVYAFYGYQTNGIFAKAADAATAGKDGKPLTTFVGTAFQAGDVHFVDQNDDGVIDDRDRINLGSAAPLLFGNFNTSIQSGNFELSANFSYSLGNKMYNAVRRSMESMSDFSNQMITVNRRWVYDGQVTDIPRASYGDPMGNSRFSDRWIEDASFIRLKELMLSYQLKKLMKGTTVFIAGENLLTLTNYLGMDPETMYSYDASMRGFDYAKVAHPRSYKLGFKIQF